VAIIADIAREARVSITTVSRVFNKHPYVKDDVREKVLSFAEKLDYKPGFTANRNVIALIVEGIEKIALTHYEQVLLSYISSYITKSGYRLEIIPLSNLDMLRETFVPSAIAILFKEESQEILRNNCRVPVVTINALIDGFPAVCSDHAGGIKRAVSYLADRGHKRISLVQNNDKNWGGKERLNGYQAAIKAMKLEEGKSLSLHKTLEDSSWFEIVREIYDAQATAMIIGGEDQALPAVHALNLLGIKIPSDLSVISFENANISPFLYPEHTTIAQNFADLGNWAVKAAT